MIKLIFLGCWPQRCRVIQSIFGTTEAICKRRTGKLTATEPLPESGGAGWRAY